MAYIRRALIFVAIASGTLLIAAISCALLLIIVAHVWPSPDEPNYQMELVVAAALVTYPMLFGVPAICVMAPIYTALARFGQANWYLVVPLSIAPGVVLWFWSSDLGLVAIVAGLFVGATTHYTLNRLQEGTESRVGV
jgi:hypothetical protein